LKREVRIARRKKRFLALALIVLFILGFLLHRQVINSVYNPAAEGVYYRVETDEKSVAFTFEAVWGAGKTAEILNLLDRHNVQATFFLSGQWLRKYADLARGIVLRGHEIGLHGYEHKLLTEMSDEELEADFVKAKEALQEELALETRLYRPPYGEFDSRVLHQAQGCGLTTVIWSINAGDLTGLTYDEMVRQIRKKIHNGAIIMFHTHSSQSVKALPVIIQTLRQNGYEILPFTALQQKGFAKEEAYEIQLFSGI